MQETSNIGFIGAGNMASAIIAGLIKQGYCHQNIKASNLHQEKLMALEKQYAIATTTDNREIVQTADVVILAVKPQVLPAVIAEIAPLLLARQPLILSVAAGVSTTALFRKLGGTCRVIRAMPNMAAMVGCAVTALFANDHCLLDDKHKATYIFNAVGATTWLQDESLMDAVTAVSGSGPAYVFYFMQALVDAAMQQGLPEDISVQLVQQLLRGSVELAAQSSLSLTDLRGQVTSPGGTTAAGLSVLHAANFNQLIADTIASSCERARELGALVLQENQKGE